MLVRAIRIIADLTRFDASALTFLVIFAPVYYHTGQLEYAVQAALPLLLISMSGFLINNLYDVERDQENHPERALPSGAIHRWTASVIYFTLLAASLVLVRAYVELSNVFLYLLLIIALINYNYVVSTFPYLKDAYVAATVTLPIFILNTLLPAHQVPNYVTASLFLYFLGKEMLRDIMDMGGDEGTLPHKLGVRSATLGGFGIKFISDVVLLTASDNTPGRTLAGILLFSDFLSALFWQRHSLRAGIVQAMKAQVLIGLLYLF